MRYATMHRLLRYAAMAAIVALALLVWSFFDPQPIASVVALTVGQGLGTASLLTFIVIVIADLRRKNVFPSAEEEREDSLPPRPRRSDGKDEQGEVEP